MKNFESIDSLTSGNIADCIKDASRCGPNNTKQCRRLLNASFLLAKRENLRHQLQTGEQIMTIAARPPQVCEMLGTVSCQDNNV